MPSPVAETHGSDGFWQPDALIAWLAELQHGVVSVYQLRLFGLSRGEIEHRVRRKRLHRVHHGVYAVGHSVLTARGIWMAAVLAGGDYAVLSHYSAASLWLLRRGAGPRTHITVPQKRRSRQTITVHFGELAPDEITYEDDIPVTTPGRTLIDLAPLLPSPSLARAVEAAEGMRWTGPSLSELIDRYPGRAGTPKLQRILARPGRRTRSDLEAAFLDFAEAASLPRPEANQVVEGHEVDAAWHGPKVIVEVDTYATHGSDQAFERDRARDRALQAAGWTVVRVTDRQMNQRTAEELRRLLSKPGCGNP